MPHRFILLLFVLASFIAGCDTESGPSTSGGVLVPLAIGNSWTYEVSRYDSLVTAWSLRDVTRKITDTIRINGELFYRLNQSEAAATNRPDGYWTVVVPSASPHRYAKYPVGVGEQFDRDTIPITDGVGPDIIDYGLAVTTLVSNAATVTVPSGTFVAYQYETMLTSQSTGKPIVKAVLSMVPGIGEIKTEQYNYLQNGMPWLIERSILISYTLN